VEFARALANISFVLPSRVTRGLKEAGGIPIAEGGKLRKSKGYAAPGRMLDRRDKEGRLLVEVDQPRRVSHKRSAGKSPSTT